MLATLGGGLSTARAQGEGPDARSVRVDYQSGRDCPTASGFLERIAMRSANIRVVRDGDTAWRLVVRVVRSPHGPEAHGDLSIRSPDGSEARRAVDGDTCDSVVDALALMSAMALDPAVVPRATTPDVSPPAPAATVTASGGNDADAHPATTRSPAWQLPVWAGGGAVFGIAPVAVPDVWGAVELARAVGGLGSSSVRAGFDYANSGAASVTGGGIRVVRSVGVVEACPAWWSPGPFRLAPCLHLEAGTLAASGLEVTPERSAVRPWLAVGAVGSVRYVPVHRLFVELAGGLHLPLVRDRFYFEPDTTTTVYRAPAVAGFVSGAIGFRIL